MLTGSVLTLLPANMPFQTVISGRAQAYIMYSLIYNGPGGFGMGGESVLLILIIIGIVGKAPLIATSACILLVLKLTNLTHYFGLIERRGLELGLLFLMLSVLIPFAEGKITLRDLRHCLLSVPGVLALAGGALATYMNGDGLRMLKNQPELLIGLVVGSIAGIVFLKGIPVGPLMAAGLTALFLKLFKYLS